VTELEDDYHGAKAALFNRGRVLAYLRDQKPNIQFPGFWDLPGGGREGNEDPTACAQREIEEEFGLSLPRERFLTCRRYEGIAGGAGSYFLTADLEDAEVEAISFGDEGQRWALLDVTVFLGDLVVVPALKMRLRDHLYPAEECTPR